jgi:hypothetical protein
VTAGAISELAPLCLIPEPLEWRMTIVEGILLTVSVVVFIYLGVAVFKPEWF